MTSDKSIAPDADRLAELAREGLPELPKRFYKSVDVEERANAFSILLDSRGVKTPGKSTLEVPTRALAERIASEWDAQGERIDPAQMPLTRLSNTVIDGVSQNADLLRDEIVQYAGSDLLCYRATSPEGLVARQQEIWDPLLDWSRDTLGATFVQVAGIMPVSQPQSSLDQISEAVADLLPFHLGALHVLMTLSGSSILALAVHKERIDAHTAWAAAHVDEDWRISLWGADDEAEQRRALRWREFAAAAEMLSLS